MGGHEAVVKLLLEKEANQSVADQWGKLALSLAMNKSD